MCSFKCEDIPHMDKEETFFLENCTLVWSEFFLDNYLLIRHKNLKTIPEPYLEN